MTKEERVKYWIDIAEYDYDTAEVMLKSGRRSMWRSCATRLWKKCSKHTGVQHRRKSLHTFTT